MDNEARSWTNAVQGAHGRFELHTRVHAVLRRHAGRNNVGIAENGESHGVSLSYGACSGPRSTWSR